MVQTEEKLLKCPEEWQEDIVYASKPQGLAAILGSHIFLGYFQADQSLRQNELTVVLSNLFKINFTFAQWYIWIAAVMDFLLERCISSLFYVKNTWPHFNQARVFPCLKCSPDLNFIKHIWGMIIWKVYSSGRYLGLLGEPEESVREVLASLHWE